MKTFNVYITDLFAGELNYSYVTKFVVTANTERGAVCKVSKEVGLNFRKQYDEIYHSTSKLTGLVVDDSDYPSYDYENAFCL